MNHSLMNLINVFFVYDSNTHTDINTAVFFIQYLITNPFLKLLKKNRRDIYNITLQGNPKGC